MSILNRLFGSKAPKEGTMRGTRSARTVRDLLMARTPPWNRVPPIVITTILEAITDKGLLEAFATHSMDAGLVARYETLGRDGDSPDVIRSQVSQILCETGNRAIPSLAKALAAKQTDAAHKAIMLAGDTFEAAIALTKNQIAAYAGLAAIYSMVGKSADAQKYAKLGLTELEEMRRAPGASALRERSILPPDIFEQAERQLRGYLAS
jgi:hypothetical protein